jgi:hypothetical protein
MKYKVKEINYFNLDHGAVAKKYEGDLSFIGYMCLNAGPTVAVYRAANPNFEKGHKEFMLLSISEGGGFVSGRTKKSILNEAKHTAVRCLECNTVIYSLNRHHYNTCGCLNDVFIDGGKEAYSRVGAKDLTLIEIGTYNALTKRYRPSKPIMSKES